jgi:hypothetical protein
VVNVVVVMPRFPKKWLRVLAAAAVTLVVAVEAPLLAHKLTSVV